MGKRDLQVSEFGMQYIEGVLQSQVDKRIAPPMFHGTDARFVSMDSGRRQEILNAADIIIESLLPIFEDSGFVIGMMGPEENARFKSLLGESAFLRVGDALVKGSAYKRGGSSHRHGPLFLTNDPIRAAGYASRSWLGGELGWVAYNFVWGASRCGFEMPGGVEFGAAIACMEQCLCVDMDPCVVMICNLNRADLAMENGRKVSDLFLNWKGEPTCSFELLVERNLTDGLVLRKAELEEILHCRGYLVEKAGGSCLGMRFGKDIGEIIEVRCALQQWELPMIGDGALWRA